MKRALRSLGRLGDAELLGLRLCYLGLRLEESPVAAPLARLHAELAARGLLLAPHAWFSTEWFSPDGVPGIAVPFYLGHARLVRLERARMGEAEGAGPAACLRLLRHEAGHALDSAFGLHKQRLWRATFGRWSEPYRGAYRARPGSRDYVQHLERWYAQSHPAEDFAETFAVWLDPRSAWRRRYFGWPALKKLRAMDEMMHALAGKRPALRCREETERLATQTMTLEEHYAEKERRYASGPPPGAVRGPAQALRHLGGRGLWLVR